MTTSAAHELIEAYWRHAQARDWAAFGALLADDVLYEVPQTRERVRGTANVVEFNRTYPGDWRAEPRRIVGEGEHGASWVDFHVDGTLATGVTFFELRDGRIARITDWWPEAYEPPARMTDKIERY